VRGAGTGVGLDEGPGGAGGGGGGCRERGGGGGDAQGLGLGLAGGGGCGGVGIGQVVGAGVAVEGDQDAESGGGEDPARAAGGEQREGDALGGAPADDDEEVDDGLDADGGGDAQSDDLGLGGALLDDDGQAGEDEGAEQGDDQDGADEAEFLADDGEDEVGGVLGEVAELLEAVAQAAAGDFTVGDGDLGLDHVVAAGAGCGVGIQEGRDAGHAVGLELDHRDAAGDDGGQGQQEVPEFGTGGQDGDDRDAKEQDGGAEVLDRDEAGDDADGGENGQQAVEEVADLAAHDHGVPGDEADEEPLGKLAGLEREVAEAELDPAVRAFAGIAQAGEVDQGQNGEHEEDEHPHDLEVPAAPGGIGAAGEREGGGLGDEADGCEPTDSGHGGQGDAHIDGGLAEQDTLDGDVGLGDFHAGGVDHDHAEHEQGEGGGDDDVSGAEHGVLGEYRRR